MNELIRVVIYFVGIAAFLGLNLAYLGWVERKGAGHIQRRTGPKEVGPFGLLQPLADGLKLMSKQLVIPDSADKWLYMSAPVLAMVPAVLMFVAIPWGEEIVPREFNFGLLMIFAFASVAGLSVLMAGWGSGNKYSLIAGTRAVSQSVAYEIPMLITAITIVMITGSMDLNEIVRQQGDYFWKWNIFRFDKSILMPLSFLVFFICSMAETNRAPFDLGEAESELVAGYMTEYGGMGFGLFMMAEYANIVIGCSLTTILFLGGWQSPIGIFPGPHWFLLKMYFLIWCFVWIRWTYPRTTLWGLLNLSWKYLIPFSLVNLLVTALFIKVF
ncbi:MAG: NADH-quinone oxidoreductase subunit NuoH [Desulfobulbaceae bacterium]|uniref:NADH-quinone oxidoreductase subunit H n=1 Tax=Candidatus Desulfobia pelagia TaxID=2841692 RepID=A0A8J6TFX5_9BACT|nr:NADH-quinone oxidoreductase subunit NuoH [Candidatus Desulfobia pelagia]